MHAMSAERDPLQDLPARGRVQDLDPHLAERLHQLRHGLGLSVEKMADRLGLWGANGADNLRQMERCKRAVPGTLQVLLPYLERELRTGAGEPGRPGPLPDHLAGTAGAPGQAKR